MSTMRQQFHPSSAKNILRKQKSIDNDKPSSDSKRIFRKQLSVDHATQDIKHANPSPVTLNFSNFLWRNSSQNLNEPNLKIVSASALKKRAQFATNSINNSVLNKQELLSDSCKTMKSANEGTKTRVNINIHLSQDEDGISDDNAPLHGVETFRNKTSVNPLLNASPRPSETTELSAASGRLSVSARRAQFQASRRIMSAPIRPLNIEDSKTKKKTRKKKVIRDKEDFDESPDEPEDIEPKKPSSLQLPSKSQMKAKPLASRSRSVLGCDQIGIETLVSMLSDGGSDSEKEEQQNDLPSPPKADAPRVRANMLRKTVSFQEDDSFLQPSQSKDVLGNRRNSNVPFAGRMRNTRSLFGNEISNLYLPNSNNDDEKLPENKNGNDLKTIKSSDNEEEEAGKPKTKKGSEANLEDKKTQDNQTPKEKECWRLYEKMKKTGLNVSYDTILRGILKPSELRLLEKQKKYLGNIEEKTDENDSPHEPQKVN